MKQRTKPSGSPSPPKSAEPLQAGGPQECGYALLIVMMAATILLISLTAALPSIYVAGQREREEELIFRGNEYARAIMLFQRQFRRYPTSVKELLETNGMHFLRRAYADPMSRKGEWRFIHADANGVVLDSRTLGRPAGTPGAAAPSPAPEAEKESRETSTFFGERTGIQGAFIVGVASSSGRESIRVWNGRTRYDQWEFIGLAASPAGPGPTPPVQPPPHGQPGQQVPIVPVLPPLTERSISQQ